MVGVAAFHFKSNPMTQKKKFDLHEQITQEIISLLDQPHPWEMPWVQLGIEQGLAENPVSGTVYRGINQLLLGLMLSRRGFDKNHWLTFNQVKEQGGNVKKGEKSSRIVYLTILFYDKKGNRYNLPEVKKMPKAEREKLERVPMLRYYYVFNIAQTEELPEQFYNVEPVKPLPEPERDEAAEELILSTGAKVKFLRQNRAYYQPASDTITLPLRSQFQGEQEFYAVAFHELAHWTGHEKRLSRPLLSKGTKSYAFEELVAELTSAFVCARLGFSKMITNNAAYISGWLRQLRDDKTYIIRAASQAQSAADYIFLCKETEERAQAEREKIAAF